MKKFILLFTIVSFSYLATGQQSGTVDFTKYADPFIGAEGEGNVFPGATVPFGMVKLGPDCNPPGSNQGYRKGEKVQGFSHVHVSGTGGGFKYGNILVAPIIGDINLSDYRTEVVSDACSPGLFSMKYKNNINIDLTASKSTGFHKYTFPASDHSKILIDMGAHLGESTFYEGQHCVGSEIKILSDSTMEGYTRIIGGWNVGAAYTVYFYAVFNTKASDYGTWKENKLHPHSNAEYDENTTSGAYFDYKTANGQTIMCKVGISFLSTGKAKANLYNEISNWNFDDVRAQAKKLWNNELSKIVVETKNEDTKKIFYSSLYRCMLMPVDRTGENPLWKSSEPYYDDFYAIWDTYRSMNPLLTIISPSREAAIVRSLIDIYEHDGYMPDARSGNCNGRTQGGSNCDMLVADAYVKGLKGIDYEKAFNAMIKNAEVAPGGDERKEGRGGINDYNKLGYISYNHERAGSRTVEYAANDFAIATVAKGLGKEKEFQLYSQRANNWQNLWRSDMESHGTKGFIWPKDRKGDWIDTINNVYVWTPTGMVWQKFDVFIGGSWPDFFYESHSWEYSFYVPHDMKTLIEKCGGKDKFISRLDTFFTNQYYGIGNEPSFLTPCLYNYAGRPDKTAYVVKTNIHKHFKSSHKGVPGNDDSGAMGSFYVLNSMGFFPNAGQDLYLITSPEFEKVTIKLENGKTFELTTKNADENNIYIQSATLNGKPFNQSWFTHNEIVNGGKFEFVMGSKPSQWGTTILPPSMSDKK